MSIISLWVITEQLVTSVLGLPSVNKVSQYRSDSRTAWRWALRAKGAGLRKD